jgi:hypothetical protein
VDLIEKLEFQDYLLILGKLEENLELFRLVFIQLILSHL